MKINSRAKGNKFERDIANLIFDHLGIQCRRNLEQWRSGGYDVIGLDGWAIECKRHTVIKDGHKQQFWAQAVAQAKQCDARPALIFKADRQPIRAMIHDGVYFPITDYRGTIEMDIELFFAIYRETQEL